MACPHLKEVVMLFCDACTVKKMLPLDRIATADPCLGDFRNCPMFRELLDRLAAQAGSPPPVSPEPPGVVRKEAPR